MLILRRGKCQRVPLVRGSGKSGFCVGKALPNPSNREAGSLLYRASFNHANDPPRKASVRKNWGFLFQNFEGTKSQMGERDTVAKRYLAHLSGT